MPSMFSFIKNGFFLSLCLFGAVWGGKLPEITPPDVTETLHQLLDAHAFHKALSPLLLQRALECYIDELDPLRTYLLKEEVDRWIGMSEDSLNQALAEIKENDFSIFEKIHSCMVSAIERRHRLEKSLDFTSSFPNASSNDLKNLQWATNEEELKKRWLLVHQLQTQVALQLDPDSRQKALQRLTKRRLSIEEEISSSDPITKERSMLSHTLKAFASSLDAHTAYFTPGEAAQFMIQLQQRLFGIGVQLRDDLNGFTIVKILEGSPASRSGFKENDRMIAIDGEPVVGMDILDAVELIRGEEGSSVCITVLRDKEGKDEKIDIDVLRGEVVIKEARIDSSLIPFGDGVIAHISLFAFYQDPMHSSSEDIHEAISAIRKEHKIKGIILDLRHNSGGVLPQAVSVTGLFITKGIVVSIKDNKGKVEHLRNVEGKTTWDGPLVVLTSRASASAAEIVAQTLQDYGRAIVVGDSHTYGKGTFQTFSLDASNNGKVNPKGEFKVTRGRYYTVSGKSPQLRGVIPDIVVPGPLSKAEIGEELAKYPLDNDAIAENFADDLEDIPINQRDQIRWLYRFNLQPCLKIYTQLLPTLRQNSADRLEHDKFYQHFLSLVEGDTDIPHESTELLVKSDPQLHETINIMKDLIVLLK